MNTAIQTRKNPLYTGTFRRGLFVREIEERLWEFNNRITGHFSAFEFKPLLGKFGTLAFGDKIALQYTERGSSVLMENEFMKATVIYWQVGKESAVHGHPRGGCMFKVLEGQLEEKRFTSPESKTPYEIKKYSESGIAYIHDSVAYHSVSNPFDVPAYSIHLYSK